MTGRRLLKLIDALVDLDKEIGVDIPAGSGDVGIIVTEEGGVVHVRCAWSPVETPDDDPAAADRRERLMKALVDDRVMACFGDGQNEEMAEHGSNTFGTGIPVWAMTDAAIIEELGYDPLADADGHRPIERIPWTLEGDGGGPELDWHRELFDLIGPDLPVAPKAIGVITTPGMRAVDVYAYDDDAWHYARHVGVSELAALSEDLQDCLLEDDDTETEIPR